MTKLAIVTGGARGIGRGCAHALARKGLDIALVDLLVPEMERTAGEIRAMGREVSCYQADVALHARAAEVYSRSVPILAASTCWLTTPVAATQRVFLKFPKRNSTAPSQ